MLLLYLEKAVAERPRRLRRHKRNVHAYVNSLERRRKEEVCGVGPGEGNEEEEDGERSRFINPPGIQLSRGVYDTGKGGSLNWPLRKKHTCCRVRSHARKFLAFFLSKFRVCSEEIPLSLCKALLFVDLGCGGKRRQCNRRRRSGTFITSRNLHPAACCCCSWFGIGVPCACLSGKGEERGEDPPPL